MVVGVWHASHRWCAVSSVAWAAFGSASVWQLEHVRPAA
jgi:hypothetical protein